MSFRYTCLLFLAGIFMGCGSSHSESAGPNKAESVKSVICLGSVTENGVKTNLPEKIVEFEVAKSKTVEWTDVGDMHFQFDWDASNKDGHPLLSVGFLKPDLARFAKATAENVVVLTDLTSDEKSVVSVACGPLNKMKRR